MLFGNNKQAIRQAYFDAWQKHLQQEKNTQAINQPITPLESQIIDVILLHPEYQQLLTDSETYQDKDYLPEAGETNPFLHMGLHLAIRDQVGLDKPKGIQAAFLKLCAKTQDQHQAEHLVMDALAEQLWQAQRNQQELDEHNYLIAVKNL